MRKRSKPGEPLDAGPRVVKTHNYMNIRFRSDALVGRCLASAIPLFILYGIWFARWPIRAYRFGPVLPEWYRFPFALLMLAFLAAIWTTDLEKAADRVPDLDSG